MRPHPSGRNRTQPSGVRTVLLALLCWWTLAVVAAGIGAAAEPEVGGIRFGIHGGRTRFVVDFDRRVEPAVAVLPSPPRLVVDLPEVRFRIRADPLGRPRGLATAQRYGRLEPGRSRIVVDLAAPSRIVARSLLPPSSTSRYWRFVLDLEPLAGAAGAAATDETEKSASPRPSEPRPSEVVGSAAPPLPPSQAANAGRAETAASPRPGTTESAPPSAVVASPGSPSPALPEASRAQPAPAAPTPPLAQPSKPGIAAVARRPVIVLDPGHGGIDPGTIGVNGAMEKDITLAMARALERALEAKNRYDVHLTREDDRFVALRERVAIARRFGADLFLSLHADSLHDGEVRGASIYTVSEQASDAEADRLARKENRADVLAGVDLSVQDDVVAGILIDLARRDTNNKSITFAETLITEIDGVAELLKRTRRYAGFVVLKSPDTPSVLLELGYLSNRRDAERLSDARYRERLAAAVARAIDRYFDSLRPPL
ncbi:N-acetylmuramoyl-L-alanine amidase AmiA [bacterium HR40]|nr:N-acetylmuramoyl-L-alanine amidase AmiA [bacterium HR40]